MRDTRDGWTERDALAEELEAATGDAVIVVDGDGRITRWSAHASRMLGLGSVEMLGRTVDSLPLPARSVDGPSVFAKLARGLRWGASAEIVGQDGKRTRLVWSGTPMRRASGAFSGAIFRVCTAALEGQPLPSPGTYAERAFEATTGQLVVLDRHRRVLAANSAVQATVEWSRASKLELGEDVLSACAPGSEPDFLSGFARALDGERCSRKGKQRYPNGTEFDAVVEFTPLLRDGDGAVEAVLFEVRGTPAREGGLRCDVLERALEALPVALVIADARKPDMPIVHASGAVERVTGYSPKELVGQNSRVFHADLTNQASLSLIRHAIAAGEQADVVVRNRRKDGSTYLNRLRLLPVRDDLGAVSHFVGVQDDVSAQEALTTRLLEAQTGAATQRMLGGAVHDLRNMLTVVGAQVGLAREDVAPGTDVAECLDAASEAVQQAAVLTRLLLTPMSRPSGIAKATPVVEVLSTLGKAARYVLQPSVSLSIEGAPDGCVVVGDPGMLEHVLLNLVLNANDAMPGGGAVRVSVSRGLPEELVVSEAERRREAEHWTISVSDDGPGMSAEVLARLFQPYFTTKQGRGTGLGLTTCATLLAASGARIRVRSEEGRGATFYVSLVPAHDALRAERAGRAVSARTVAGLEALVVEADASVRAALSACLHRRGARVRDASDLLLARDYARALGPDALLVIDAQGAATQTHEFLAEWLTQPRRRALVLGGPDAAELPRDARVRSLAKPFDYDELILTVTKLTAAA